MQRAGILHPKATPKAKFPGNGPLPGLTRCSSPGPLGLCEGVQVTFGYGGGIHGRCHVRKHFDVSVTARNGCIRLGVLRVASGLLASMPFGEMFLLEQQFVCKELALAVTDTVSDGKKD